MKKIRFFNLFALFLLLISADLYGQFCSSTAFLSQDQTLYKINTTTNPFTFTPIGTANVGGTEVPQSYNALGYNPVDGYLYAVRQELALSDGGPTERYLIKINPTTGQMVGVPRQILKTNGTPIVAGGYRNGDFDPNGNYYLKGQSNSGMYKVNVVTARAELILFNPLVNVASADIAYNINDGMLYGVSLLASSEGQLFKIDPANGNIVFVGSPFDEGATFGAMIGANGKIYGSSNGGNFYQFNLTTGQPTLISTSPFSINNDGANCVTNDLVFPADPYITKTDNTATYIAGTTTTYTIEAGNNGPFGVLGALVQDNVPAGIPAANVSISRVYSGGAALSSGGNPTGNISDNLSLPVGAKVTYTVTVNIPAGFTGNLTNTATITSPLSEPDTNTANNTVTDTDTQALATLCSSEVFLSRTGAPSTTQLLGVNFSTGNPSGLNAVGGNAPYVYNGMAHNPKDGFIYAMDQNGPNLLKINPGTGVVTNLGTVPGLVSGLYAGEIDNNGIYYISGGSNRLYKIDLTVTPLAATSVLYSGGVSPGYLDLGYNVNDGFLYGISGSTLNRIDPANGNITTIGTATHPGTYGGMIGANGDIYGVLNAGEIHKFNITTGVHTVVTTVSSGSGADAAHCVTSPLVLDADLQVTKTDGILNYVPGSTTTYTIVVKNNGPFGLQDAQVSDPVPAGIPAANVSYTAVASAGSSTNVTGTITGAINDLVSLPKDGTVTYTVTVNIPVSFTGDLVNTVTVTPPINVNDTDMTNNTATDTDIQTVVTPFACNSSFYLSQYPTGGPTTLYSLNNNTNPFTVTSLGTSPAGYAVNGIGYNTVDNLIYGISNDGTANPNPNHLIRIDGTGAMVDFGTITGLPGVGYNNGTFDDNGNLYTTRFGTNKMYRINVVTKTATEIVIARTVQVNDLVYDKSVGKLFGYEGTTGTNRLISIDTSAPGTVTNIGISGLPDGTLIGALFIDANGDIFGNADNGTGFFQFDRTTGKAVKISSSVNAFGNDGANCPDAVITFPADLSVTKDDGKTTYVPGTSNTYTIVVSNTSGPYGVLGATVSDPLPSGIPAANMSYSVPVLTGGATTSITGIQTGALSDVVSLPVGATITYTVTVNIPAGFTGNLTNTATITSPLSVPDTNTANNTVTDTDTQALATLCSSEVFLSRTGAPSTTQLFGVNFSTGNPSGLNAVGGNAPYVYNGMAHNPKDGFIYAMDQNGPNLLKINPGTGVVTNLGTVPGLVSGLYAGEIDNNGIYYISGGSNRLYKIDLTVTPLAATSVLYSGGVSPGYLDLGYNVNDGFLYGISGSTLNRIDPANGNITTIGTATHPGTYGGMIGANGDIYGVLNAGGIHKFNITTGVHTVVTTISSGSGADAAHCVTSPLVFDANLSVTKNDGTLNYVPGSTTIYTIVVKNNGPFGLQDAKVSDLVPAGIPAANVSYTAVVSAGSSTNVTGTMTGAINDLVSLPKDGTVTYTVTVNIPASFTGDLVNTVTVTPPINVNDTDMTNNTATDTDSGVCYRDPVTTGTTAGTKVGITLLKRAGTDNADNWPMVRKGGHIALESNTQGFVVTRIAKADLGNITAPQEGMMMYDTTDKCLKIYSDGLWKCFSTPACP